MNKHVSVSKSSEIDLIKKYTHTFLIDNYHLQSLCNGSSIFALLEIFTELKFRNLK